ncbi:MAG: dTDP-4-dehydrorhamnose reductase [Desulfobacterales bacterium GWB2_56_26]|nr:MAG: dTDP-4-dehydrorhamnose reductase [Desulfobacterales bacterium GWB2_56_26]
MKIVIIGAHGQLGSDCCKLFAAEHETVGCDLPRIDIGNEANVTEYLTAQRPDVIVNCAAYTAVDACEKEVELAWRINAEGPKYLARAADKLGSRLIHVSTDYVFDGNKPVPEAYVEIDATNPLSEYGRSKLAGEQAVAGACADHVILRTAWLYSGYGKNFLKTMLRLALTGPSRELKVVDDQHGSLTWSRTLARQIEQLLQPEITGIAHATAEGYSTWYQAARYFLDSMQVDYAMRPCTTAEYTTPAHRPANSILENAVLKDAGIAAFIDWREDLDRYVAEYREQLLVEARSVTV